MQVQPIVKTQTSFKLILSLEEKQQRKTQIDKLVNQVLASQSEWQDAKDIDIKMVRKLVTKKYDAIIRQKVLNSIWTCKVSKVWDNVYIEQRTQRR